MLSPSQRVINGLEDKLGLIYIDQLREITETDLLSLPGFKDGAVAALRAALQNWLDGRQVKQIEDGIRMSDADD